MQRALLFNGENVVHQILKIWVVGNLNFLAAAAQKSCSMFICLKFMKLLYDCTDASGINFKNVSTKLCFPNSSTGTSEQPIECGYCDVRGSLS